MFIKVGGYMNLTQMKQYLSQLSSLDKLHKISFPEKPHHIEVPQLLSQFIAKYVLSPSEYDGPGKIFDAQVKEGKEIKYYEIKGTSSYKMSADVDYTKKPNVLVWVLVDVEENEETVISIPTLSGSMQQVEYVYEVKNI